MTKLDTVNRMTQPNATEEPTMSATKSTQTRRPSARQLVALAVAVVLLLALATGAAVRQMVTARPASRAPAAPTLAHDGYAPTRMDYREDHRADVPAGNAAPSAVPCTGRDLALAGACGPAGGNAPQAPAAAAAQQQRLAALDALFSGPAVPTPDPRAVQQRQRPAWLDARDYGPASGGTVPICNGDGAVIGNACIIP